MRTLAVMACALAVCNSHVDAQDVDLSTCGSVVRTYYPRPLRAIEDRFLDHDLDTQFRLYICGTQYIHPPLFGLADTFASQGEPAAAFLLEKLRAGVRDATVRDIVGVFAYMKLRRTYDAEAETAVMQLVEDRVRSIRDPARQEQAQIWLDMLRRLGDVGGQPRQGQDAAPPIRPPGRAPGDSGRDAPR